MTDISPADLSGIQGDILRNGFPKKAEIFSFFTIKDEKLFCEKIASLHKQFATGEDVKQVRERLVAFNKDKKNKGTLMEATLVNIAFTFRGLLKLSKVQPTLKNGLTDDNDLKKSAPSFVGGMQAATEQEALGDPNFTGPIFESKGAAIDGVLLVAGRDKPTVELELMNMLMALNGKGGNIIQEVGREVGEDRKDEMEGHEHFGFNDGISHPQVFGIDDKLPSVDNKKVVEAFDTSNKKDTSNFVDPGVILVGRKGEHQGVNPGLGDKPKWMKDGSFLVFRKLEQHVGKWNDFMKQNFKNAKLDSAEQLGARFMGRWQSGCPLTTSITKDEGMKEVKTQEGTIKHEKVLEIAFKNDFGYGSSSPCPVAAHVRKMHIRQGFNPSRIMRRGIPYGPDFKTGMPDDGRGLLFAAYQSTIEDGYKFIQQSWANNPDFPLEGKSGYDITIGQKQEKGTKKSFVGTDVPVELDSINRFVKPLGGEYFFAPSIQVLKDGFKVPAVGPAQP